MNIPTNWRDRRTIMSPLHNPYASYTTDTKANMKKTYADDMFLTGFHLGPDTLRKNLADTIITQEKMAPRNCKMKLEKEIKVEENVDIPEEVSPLSGIANFISGVVNVISSVMFTKRKPAELSSTTGQPAPPSMWQNAKHSDENKILQDDNLTNDMSSEFFATEMSDCRSAAAHCQSKLDQVRFLLGTNKPTQCSLRVRKRPKKVFVEPSSVEDCFEDAFSPEDFENLANDSYIEFFSPICHHEHSFHNIDSPKTKVEVPVIPKMDNQNLPLKPSVLNAEKMVSDTSTVCDNSYVNTKQKVDSKISDCSPENHLVHNNKEAENNVPELNKDILESESRKEIVESCEDKLTKLKLLLQERNKKPKRVHPPEETQPVTTVENSPPSPMLILKAEPQPLTTLPPRPKPSNKVKDKKYKNPNRCTDKRRKSKMKKSIEDDLLFANEIHCDDLSSSVENSPSTNCLENYMKTVTEALKKEDIVRSQPKPVPTKDSFDEVSGCFRSESVESDDSFQIVFHDSPRATLSSDCESDDFDIVFEDSPGNCYTSNDVFGDSDESTDSEDCDSDSDLSDSDCGNFKLSGSLSKSVCNLADDSLYMDHSEDEVDCANIQNLGICDSVAYSEIEDNAGVGDSNGVLLNERKKLLKKKLPAKRVRFSESPPKVHVMRVWLFAAKQTRVRYWQQFAVDRERFKRRIADVDMAVSWVLKPQHRSRIMFQRFMPWWNAQKRKEIAEKKEREAQEKIKKEEELKLEKEKQEKEEADNIAIEDITNSCASQSQDEKEVGNDSFKTTRTCVEDKTVHKEDSLNRDRVIEEKQSDNRSPIIEEVKKNNSVASENIKNNNNKNVTEKLYSTEIVPLNDKTITLSTGFVNLQPEYVSLNT